MPHPAQNARLFLDSYPLVRHRPDISVPCRMESYSLFSPDSSGKKAFLHHKSYYGSPACTGYENSLPGYKIFSLPAARLSQTAHLHWCLIQIYFYQKEPLTNTYETVSHPVPCHRAVPASTSSPNSFLHPDTDKNLPNTYPAYKALFHTFSGILQNFLQKSCRHTVHLLPCSFRLPHQSEHNRHPLTSFQLHLSVPDMEYPE